MPKDDKLEEFIYREVEEPAEEGRFNFSEFLESNKLQIAGILIGLILIGIGILLYKQGYFSPSDSIEVIDAVTDDITQKSELIIEVSGAIEKPGVYKLSEGSRVEDLLIAAGGISADADRGWVEKYINRAAKLADGQKLYILKNGEDNSQSQSSSATNVGGIKQDQGVLGTGQSGLININSASLSELDSLPGIGPVYGQSIIDHRPYSSVEELLSKGALKDHVYQKVKDQVTVY
jgi:competence protein ComEA